MIRRYRYQAVTCSILVLVIAHSQQLLRVDATVLSRCRSSSDCTLLPDTYCDVNIGNCLPCRFICGENSLERCRFESNCRRYRSSTLFPTTLRPLLRTAETPPLSGTDVDRLRLAAENHQRPDPRYVVPLALVGAFVLLAFLAAVIYAICRRRALKRRSRHRSMEEQNTESKIPIEETHPPDYTVGCRRDLDLLSVPERVNEDIRHNASSARLVLGSATSEFDDLLSVQQP